MFSLTRNSNSHHFLKFGYCLLEEQPASAPSARIYWRRAEEEEEEQWIHVRSKIDVPLHFPFPFPRTRRTAWMSGALAFSRMCLHIHTGLVLVRLLSRNLRKKMDGQKKNCSNAGYWSLVLETSACEIWKKPIHNLVKVDRLACLLFIFCWRIMSSPLSCCLR